MKLHKVTFTGVDDETDLDELIHIGNEFPFVEFGILFSTTNRNNRYSSNVLSTLKHLCDRVPVSLHVCGKAVPMLLNFHPELTPLLDVIKHSSANRIQLNFNHSKGLVSLQQLDWFIGNCRVPVITQVNSNNDVINKVISSCDKTQYLFDSSGGCGKVITEFPKPPGIDIGINSPMFGYAGGIGSDNLFEVLGKMGAVLPNKYHTWIDMESSIRTLDNYFDIEACVEIADMLKDTNYIKSHMDY